MGEVKSLRSEDLSYINPVRAWAGGGAVGKVRSLRSEDLSYIPRRGGLWLRLNVVTHTYIEAGTPVEKDQGPESCGYF